MPGNLNLQKAKTGRNDEFYTQLSDIENELRHYKEHFKGKTVLCNCDDPRVSNFFHYFAYNFEHLGLKKLITTCYKNQNPDLFSMNESEKAVYLVYDGDTNGNHTPDAEEIGIHELKGDGDFRSAECIELLKQADIVVTNPPFSLFKYYVPLLIQYDKDFLVIGNQNAITYKEIFPLIKDNKLWIGMTHPKEFIVPSFDRTNNNTYTDDVGNKKAKFGNICWFTNLDIKKRHEDLIMYKNYNNVDYPKYETFDGIDVGTVADIPEDFDGVMGVPKTFLEKYNPNQFEILGYEREDENIKVGIQNMPKSFLEDYKKNGGKGHYTSGMKMLCFYDKDGIPKIPFSRILIRRKK